MLRQLRHLLEGALTHVGRILRLTLPAPDIIEANCCWAAVRSIDIGRFDASVLDGFTGEMAVVYAARRRRARDTGIEWSPCNDARVGSVNRVCLCVHAVIQPRHRGSGPGGRYDATALRTSSINAGPTLT
jgi:hypothetical protein